MAKSNKQLWDLIREIERVVKQVDPEYRTLTEGRIAQTIAEFRCQEVKRNYKVERRNSKRLAES